MPPHLVTGSFGFNQLTINGSATLHLGTTGTASVSGTLVNNGVIRVTRDITATGGYTFGLASGPVNGAYVSLNVTTDNFNQITLDRHDGGHPYKVGTSVITGIGWENYWGIIADGSGILDVTLPTPSAITPSLLTTVCHFPDVASPTQWNCAADSYTSNTVTRNGVSNFSDWAVGSNVGPNAITLNSLAANDPASDLALPLALLAIIAGVGGVMLIKSRRAA